MCVTALLIGLFVGRPLIARMFAPNVVGPSGTLQIAGASPVMGALPPPPGAAGGESAPEGPAALGAPGGASIDISGIEGKVRESSVKKIGEVVNAHPEEALAIIRTWLHQPV